MEINSDTEIEERTIISQPPLELDTEEYSPSLPCNDRDHSLDAGVLITDDSVIPLDGSHTVAPTYTQITNERIC